MEHRTPTEQIAELGERLQKLSEEFTALKKSNEALRISLKQYGYGLPPAQPAAEDESD